VPRATDGCDLQIGSVRLTLHAVASRSYCGALNFGIPLIGTEVNLGGKLSRQVTHEIEISLVPLAPRERPELCDSNLGDAPWMRSKRSELLCSRRHCDRSYSTVTVSVAGAGTWLAAVFSFPVVAGVAHGLK
jgi:hypothetical protein